MNFLESVSLLSGHTLYILIEVLILYFFLYTLETQNFHCFYYSSLLLLKMSNTQLLVELLNNLLSHTLMLLTVLNWIHCYLHIKLSSFLFICHYFVLQCCSAILRYASCCCF